MKTLMLWSPPDMAVLPSQTVTKALRKSPAMPEAPIILDPSVRTVIDIGGQDSKVIRLDENGAVVNFVMNDKCAAGTGRFLEMMARTHGNEPG